jgi:hypothetical protein
MTTQPSTFFSRLKEALPAGAALLAVSAALVWAAGEPPEQREALSYDPAGHRDPFVPLVRDGRLVGVAIPGVAVNTSRPVLYGILWDPGGNSIALINDAEVRVGETIGGYKVKEIREDAVVLDSGGVPVVLEIMFETPPSQLSPGGTTGGGRQ